ncbi:Fur-regulated basic protein FbpA [Sutcliffiella cohnii]
MQLLKAVEQEKEMLINKLINMGYFETDDGRQLYELSPSEIKQIYENEKCRREVFE